MARQRVFIVGSGGETGKHILNALIGDESFDVVCFIRTSSEDKPSTQQLRDRRIKTAVGELTGPKQHLVVLLKDIDTVISCLSPSSLKEQIPLVDAALEAGVKRFAPCHWGTPSARGVLALKDVKEEIDDYIFRHRQGFTVIDVGFWFQASVPRVPSGKFDSAIFVPIDEVYAGGSAPNMLIDARDVGRITAEIIKDERTLNKRVIAYAEVLSQNQIQKIIEDKTGESLELKTKSDDEARAALKAAEEAFGVNPGDRSNRFRLAAAQYAVTKYVRADNTPENAAYLGYISARDLFPTFKYRSFTDFVDELIEGKIERPYPQVNM